MIVILTLVLLGLTVVFLVRMKGCKCGEKYIYSYMDAYNDAYSPPRPTYHDRCPEYNEWVREANLEGKRIVDECNKKYPGDERCPRFMPWLEVNCES